MAWALYDYQDGSGNNDFESWSKGLQKYDRAKLSRKLKMLEDNGPDLGPRLLAGPIKHHAHIYKLIINGRVALRPLLCKGPINNETEFTLLKGAFEVDWKWVPADAPSDAETRRNTVKANPQRRCNHVNVA